MEAGFLLSIAEDRSADVTRLVYADWLDEQGDSVSQIKAEYLRLLVALAHEENALAQQRLTELASQLDLAWRIAVRRTRRTHLTTTLHCVCSHIFPVCVHSESLATVDKMYTVVCPINGSRIRFPASALHQVETCPKGAMVLGSWKARVRTTASPSVSTEQLVAATPWWQFWKKWRGP
jgi:uncharacterized protein (TIGR02996 family)